MRWLVLGMIALACGPRIEVAADGDTSGTTGTGTTELTSATTSPGTTSSTSSETSTSGDGSSDDADDGRTFITPNPDAGDSTIECDVWAQNCPRGGKCMPWAHDGGGYWNATRCTPIADDAHEIGEPCTVLDSGMSGIDDCVLGAICFHVDYDTGIGRCVGLCGGSEVEPTCEDPCVTCVITSGGVLNICLPACDPILQDCARDEACYPTAEGFWCSPDLSEGSGAIGDPCTLPSECDPGLLCAPAANLPDCVGDDGCCTPACDLDTEDECAAVVPGTSCVSWFGDIEPKAGCSSATRGACVVAL